MEHYGHYLRILHYCVDHALTNALSSVELTAAQGKVMGFVTHADQPPRVRDIEEAFDLSHPTVLGILDRLEKKGFVEFRSDPQDKRCKRIYVLPKGKELEETMHRTIVETEEKLIRGFSQEEQALFGDYLRRAIQNVKRPNPKEE